VKIEELAEVFYANEIRPIFDANCQKSGCHGSNSSIPTFATYEDVKAKASSIKARTSAKSMPPAGPLSDSNIKLIADWVDQGAPNN
jgi:mono/diheme cytochrome c family protein